MSSTSRLAIENRNFLSPVGFQVAIDRLKGTTFFVQKAGIPTLRIASADTGTRFNKIPQPGDELQYEEFTMQFLVDENMKNYYQVHDWMREIGTPVSSREFRYSRGSVRSQNVPPNKSTREYDGPKNQWRSDISLVILSSNYQPVSEFIYRDCFPTSLTGLTFDSSVKEVNYFTASASFKYTYFDYEIQEAAEATDTTMEARNLTSYMGEELRTKP